MNPVISLCHATARLPEGWKKAADLWHQRADRPERIEYILGIDSKADWKGRLPEDFPLPRFGESSIVVNQYRQCAVDGWNATARQARGKLLITVADDWYPCEHWDTELLKVLPDLEGDYVLDVSTGGNDALLTFSILTRGYFNRLTRDYGYEGGFFYSEYIGMYADNDFDAVAKRDGVVIRAKHLYFEHDHPAYNNTRKMDDVYRRQHRNEAFAVGRRVFLRRMKEFDIPVSPSMRGEPEQANRVLAFLVPGENFSQAWVGAWTEMMTTAMEHYQVTVQFGYSSNIYLTRQAMWDALRTCTRKPDLILWIDDDQILTVDGLKRLLKDLEERPDLDGVAGWAWCEQNIYGGAPMLSYGVVNGDGESHRMTPEKMREAPGDLIEISYSGFPAVLLRGNVLDKCPDRAFLPIFDEAAFGPWGMSGEDSAFFFKCRSNGLKFAVDRRVKVPHLKLRCAEPVEGASLGVSVQGE